MLVPEHGERIHAAVTRACTVLQPMSFLRAVRTIHTQSQTSTLRIVLTHFSKSGRNEVLQFPFDHTVIEYISYHTLN